MIEALLQWQMAVLAAAVGLCWAYLQERPSRHALLAPVCFTASIALFNLWVYFPEADLALAYKIFNAGINGQLAIYTTVAFYFVLDAPARDDLAAKMLWMIVLVAEAWGLAFNNIGCNLVLETATFAELSAAWGVTEAKSVCEREVGAWLEWLPLLLELGLMAWLIQRFGQAKRKMDLDRFSVH